MRSLCPVVGMVALSCRMEIARSTLAVRRRTRIRGPTWLAIPRRRVASGADQGVGSRQAHYWYRLGQIKARLVPEGTKGHRDLRRRAERVHFGGGLRPWVAAPGDLVRMMEALGRPEEAEELEAMRRVVELDRGLRLEP